MRHIINNKIVGLMLWKLCKHSNTSVPSIKWGQEPPKTRGKKRWSDISNDYVFLQSSGLEGDLSTCPVPNTFSCIGNNSMSLWEPLNVGCISGVMFCTDFFHLISLGHMFTLHIHPVLALCLPEYTKLLVFLQTCQQEK